MKKTSLQAFEFRSDFSIPRPPKPATVTLGVAELAAMLEEARTTGANDVRTERLDKEALRLDVIASELSTALSEMVSLAHHLETLDLPAPHMDEIRSRINSACSRIIDQQGDLFDEAFGEPDMGAVN